jgi:hypothetical protein
MEDCSKLLFVAIRAEQLLPERAAMPGYCLFWLLGHLGTCDIKTGSCIFHSFHIVVTSSTAFTLYLAYSDASSES